ERKVRGGRVSKLQTDFELHAKETKDLEPRTTSPSVRVSPRGPSSPSHGVRSPSGASTHGLHGPCVRRPGFPVVAANREGDPALPRGRRSPPLSPGRRTSGT